MRLLFLKKRLHHEAQSKYSNTFIVRVRFMFIPEHNHIVALKQIGRE